MTSPRCGLPISITLRFTTGIRIPYVYLLTRMKSPTSSVGSIEPDGILNGSTRNERSRKTIRMTGKKLFEYSTHHGSVTAGSRAARLSRSKNLSSIHTAPVTTSSTNMIRAKFIVLVARRSRLFFHLQDGEERLLRDLHRADLFHSLLARLLLFEE